MAAVASPPSEIAALVAQHGKQLLDPNWRLRNLYRIVTDDSREIPFVPNAEQEDLFANLWWRNSILKARQLGFTTALCLVGLDQCIFCPNFTAVLIADTLDNARKLFRNKIQFPLQRLPEWLLPVVGIKQLKAEEVVFENGSSFSVTVTARGGTLNWLHVSEFGRICAHFPERAREIVTGSFVAAQRGIIFLESTAEGQSGPFYEISMDALKLQQSNKQPSALEFKLHFYPWWTKKTYTLADESVTVPPELQAYFKQLLEGHGIYTTPGQQRWYTVTSRQLREDMKREHPSYPEEAFEQAIRGAVYGREMAALRKQQRLTRVPHDPAYPVNTFWDLGTGDTTAIWFHQYVGHEHRFIDHAEEAGQGLAHWKKLLDEKPYTYGKHYLPHDGDHHIQGEHAETRQTIFARLGLKNTVIVPRIADIEVGIDLVRQKLPMVWIDEEKCAAGIKALDSYQFMWDEKLGTFKSKPAHTWASNSADALRQWAQGYSPVQQADPERAFRRPATSWRT